MIQKHTHILYIFYNTQTYQTLNKHTHTYIYRCVGYWVNYNDLTATSLES